MSVHIALMLQVFELSYLIMLVAYYLSLGYYRSSEAWMAAVDQAEVHV